jgi:hypothetical protein
MVPVPQHCVWIRDILRRILGSGTCSFPRFWKNKIRILEAKDLKILRIQIRNTANKVPRMYSLFFVARPHGCFETEEDLNHRLDVLSRLNDLVRQWIKVGAFQQSRIRW